MRWERGYGRWHLMLTNQKPQRCVTFASTLPPFLSAYSLQRPFADIQREKFFSKCFSCIKKWKTSRKLEWNSFVSFTVDEVNCREASKQQRKGKNRSRRKLMLCFLSELVCLLFILKQAILLKFVHFQLYIQNKQLILLVVLGLRHILTLIMFKKRFY